MGRKRKTEEVQGAEEPVEVNTDFKNVGDVEVKDEILKKPDAGTNSPIFGVGGLAHFFAHLSMIVT